LRADRLALQELSEYRCQQLRLTRLQSAMCRAETNAYREDRGPPHTLDDETASTDALYSASSLGKGS
jgi:hypothetical protein